VPSHELHYHTQSPEVASSMSCYDFMQQLIGFLPFSFVFVLGSTRV
jgi:hypothetical protein